MRIRYTMGFKLRVTVLASIALAGLFGPAVAAEHEGWTGDIALSFAAQTGTTDSIAGTLDVKGDRNWQNEEIGLRFLGSYGTSREKGSGSDETTQDSQGAFGSWKHRLDDRLFLDSRMELSRDGTQDRDVRVSVNTGPGLRVWSGEAAAKEHFDLSVGLGYRYEVYDGDANNAASEKNADSFVDVVAAFEYENLLFDGALEYTHTGSARVPANDPNSYILRTELTLGVPLTEGWDLRAGFLAEYVKVTPDPNNELTTRTTIGLAYEF